MSDKGTPLSKEIEKLEGYVQKQPSLHLYALPYSVIYSIPLYFALTSETIEYSLIGFAVIAFFHILCFLFTFWSIDFKCYASYSKSSITQASFLKVTPMPHKGLKEIVPVQHTTIDGNDVIYFFYQKRKYSFDKNTNTFNKLTYPTRNTFEYYLEQAGLSSKDITKLTNAYGPNKFEIPMPTFLELYKEQALAPFFVFQVFCVLLWCMDEYWYYSLFTLFMLLIFEATVVSSRIRNLKLLRSMSLPSHPVLAFRDDKWKLIQSSEIVPGDIVSFPKTNTDFVCPADMILLMGNCVVNEAMLTGESTPHLKEPIMYANKAQNLTIKRDGLHVLFAGTKILQVQAPTQVPNNAPYNLPSDSGCIGYVLRTGFSTTQGNLMRVILFSTERITVNSKESFLFILFLLMFALVASGYVLKHGLEDPDRSRYKLFLECVLIITSVVPPELPMELSLAVNNALIALQKLSIFCTEPFRIPFAGKVDVCCFDKTGTLTTDDLILKGVAGLSDELVSCEETAEETQFVLAGCQSLVYINNKLVGDPMETATLKALNWKFSQSDNVSGKNKSLRIAHRYHFSSSLKRMSTICVSDDNRTFVLSKGAPEKLREYIPNLPSHFDRVYKSYARKGARVIALAYKQIPTTTSDVLKKISREDAEKDLTFAGFLIFECPLKPDSAKAISMLRHSSHQIIMITGDNYLTACQVSKDLGMIDRPILVLQEDGTWRGLDEDISHNSKISDLLENFDFCVTGSSFNAFINDKHKSDYISHVKVFARVSPDQKEKILSTLKNLGKTTLMCGDGTNDVGALKQAHIGVALLNQPIDINKPKPPTPIAPVASNLRQRNVRGVANSTTTTTTTNGAPLTRQQQAAAQQQQVKQMLEQMQNEESTMVQLGDASIASPFTSKSASVLAVTHIIRQGRCALVTTHQMFKILALNCLIAAYSLSVLYLDGVRMGDMQATCAGMLIAMCFLFISRALPLEHLSQKRPRSHIFNPYLIGSVLLQFAIHLFCLIYIVNYTNSVSPREGKVDLSAPFSPNVLNSAVFIISSCMQVSTFAINYKGHPFMQSLTENKALKNSLLLAGGFTLLLASEMMPDINETFQLTPFPSAEFRNTVILFMMIDFFGCLIIDRVLGKIFSE